MGKGILDLLELAERSSKPRKTGLTVIAETSTELCRVKDILEAYGDFIDLVEVNIGLALARDRVIRGKIDLFRKHGIEVQPAGQYCNIAHYQGKMEKLLRLLRDYGITMIEIDTREVARDEDRAVEEEARYIDMAKEFGFRVMAEVGKKWPAGDRTRSADGGINVQETIKEMKQFLAAGVERVYWESMVTGAALGLKAENEEGARQILEVANSVGAENIIFEVSSMLPGNAHTIQRWWFVRNFGPEVNLASVRLDEVANVECIRRGLFPVFGGQEGTSKSWLKSIAENGGKASPTWWRE